MNSNRESIIDQNNDLKQHCKHEMQNLKEVPKIDETKKILLIFKVVKHYKHMTK